MFAVSVGVVWAVIVAVLLFKVAVIVTAIVLVTRWLRSSGAAAGSSR
jgi:hypothetical protein